MSKTRTCNTSKNYDHCKRISYRTEMLPEECGICDSTVPFSDTVHVLIHTKSDEGVLDYYVCRECYDSELEPTFN